MKRIFAHKFELRSSPNLPTSINSRIKMFNRYVGQMEFLCTRLKAKAILNLIVKGILFKWQMLPVLLNWNDQTLLAHWPLKKSASSHAFVPLFLLKILLIQ